MRVAKREVRVRFLLSRDVEIPRQLALLYMPSVFALYAIALVCLSFYRIDRGTHEENLRVLAEAAARSAPGDVT